MAVNAIGICIEWCDVVARLLWQMLLVSITPAS
jgi:hypothetical protein